MVQIAVDCELVEVHEPKLSPDRLLRRAGDAIGLEGCDGRLLKETTSLWVKGEVTALGHDAGVVRGGPYSQDVLGPIVVAEVEDAPDRT